MINFPNTPTLGQMFSVDVLGGLTWRWDGAKWIVSDIREGGSSIVTPGSGATIVLIKVGPYYVNNATTLASLTIRLPPALVDDVIDISFKSPVTSLVMQDQAGVVISAAPTSAYGPGAGLVFRYVDDVVKWVYWK